MPSAADADFLEGDGFAGEQTFEDDFETDDFFVANSDRAAFADGQNHSFTDFQCVLLPSDSLGKCFGVLKTFDGDKAATKNSRWF